MVKLDSASTYPSIPRGPSSDTTAGYLQLAGFMVYRPITGWPISPVDETNDWLPSGGQVGSLHRLNTATILVN